MLADPIVLTSDWSTLTPDTSENLTLPCIERAADHSLYGYGPEGTTQELTRLFVGHTYGRRSRFTARLTMSGLMPDVIIDNNNTQWSQSCYVVFDAPATGPVNPASYSAISLPDLMLKRIGALLISVDTAHPLFFRVMNGET